MNDKETCALAELNLPYLTSFEEAEEAAILLYRVVKQSLTLPCHLPETEAIVHKNMRMGISVTGYAQASEEQKGWLHEVYGALRINDKFYSKQKGWPESIKLTTVKPSGTLSLLPGVTPGCHPGYAQYMIRRIRIAADSPLLDIVRSNGYTVEEAIGDPRTMVAEFPFRYPDGTQLAADTTAIQQLEVVRRLQREWSDNAVSCTIYFKPEELPGIKKYLNKNFAENFKSLSFLLHAGHNFLQAPFSEISKEEYEELVARTTLITDADFSGSEDIDIGQTECVNGACPVV